MTDPIRVPRWLIIFLILGLYLTLRGYHSHDGDQAYRLPLLLHRQNPALFADDPFVRAFDAFNPHLGYLALLDTASRPLGLSTGIFALFVLTFGATCVGLDRLARGVWPEEGSRVGLVAIGLALMAKAGNIGTMHIFEAMLLDRLIGFALGWLALAWVVERPEARGGRAACAIGLATLVHPSVGLQLALVLGGSWVVWAWAARISGVKRRSALLGVAALGVALVPGLALQMGQGTRLFRGLPPEEFRLLCVELQNPQHMLPHLWRLPQWLAFACYPILALLALGRSGRANWPAARVRLAILLGVNAAGLVLAWGAVEVLHDLRVTILQPVRMATLFRGLALVAVSGRMLALWKNGRFVDRARAALVAVGMAGDWMLVVATAVDLVVSGAEVALSRRSTLRETRIDPQKTPMDADQASSFGDRSDWMAWVFALVLAPGLIFLARHDTESGHWPLLGALVVVAILPRVLRGRRPGWNGRRLVWALTTAWAVPMAALLAAHTVGPSDRWSEALIDRCRFAAVPIDDMERLAVWCRAHTPADARFIGPPGPKTFRLWSHRNLAFNRAASPYHAEGLADWAVRFRDHVDFDGPVTEFVRAYQADRHGLERRYQTMSDARRAVLARRQGARYVVAAAPERGETSGRGPLELLHTEGRYAVYHVRGPESLAIKPPAPEQPRSQVQARTAAAASAGTG